MKNSISNCFIIRTLLFAVVLNFIECTNNYQRKNESIFDRIAITDLTCGFEEDRVDLELSSISDSIEYCILKTEKEDPIGIIKKVIFDSIICIFDKQNYTIRTFNRFGIPLQTFGTSGKGPGEFVNIGSFDMDCSQNLLVIYDRMQKKLIKYNLTDASLLDEHFIQFEPSKVRILDNKRLLFFNPEPLYLGSNNYSITILNEDFSLAHRYWPRQGTMSSLKNKSMVFNHEIYKNDSGFNLYESSNCGTVHYTNGMVKPVFKYVFDNSVDYDLLQQNQSVLKLQGRIKSHYISGCFHFFFGTLKSKINQIVYNECTNQCYNIPYYGLLDNIHSGTSFTPKGVADENILYDFISPNTARLLANSRSTNNVLLHVVNQDNHDNPIIRFVHIKQK